MPSLFYVNVGSVNAMILTVERDSGLPVQPVAIQKETLYPSQEDNPLQESDELVTPLSSASRLQ